MELQKSEQPKSSRIDLRVTAEQKELNELVLSDRDWDLFVSLIENPPEPCEALKSAMKEYLEECES